MNVTNVVCVAMWFGVELLTELFWKCSGGGIVSILADGLVSGNSRVFLILFFCGDTLEKN